jgi:predicted lipid-binding transport protein (Tim44 family)
MDKTIENVLEKANINLDIDTDELRQVVTTNHPARPYMIGGAVLGVMGLLRGGGVAGLGMLIVGGFLVSKGFQEMERVRSLHGGNYHGVNSPPANR